MRKLIKSDTEYAAWIAELKNRYLQQQVKAAIKVNTQMLHYYWMLGRDIVELKAESKWGDKLLNTLSIDLQNAMPGIKGLSPVNLLYMKKFYLLYRSLGDENVPQLVEQLPSMIFQIPWGHHRLLIDRRLTTCQALFFVQKTVENGWSRSMLLNFIDTDLYERQGKSINNFINTLPATASSLASELIKDPYHFDFIQLTEKYKEKELKDALVDNITKFLMELGTGFAYMGKEFRFMIGEKEQYVDLLFYNTQLHSYVVIEVKISEFEPSYLGQLSAYISFANHILRKENDNPTIGLLICKNKDNIFAQYSLEGYNHPIGIAEFEGVNLLPDNIKSSLPSIEEIEEELNS
jgi:predicted nuclease of restriction endonuclease-like (RecB) superfamily